MSVKVFDAGPSSGVGWTEEQARQSARALLATASITKVGLRLLRLRNNAVFQVDQRYVLRVARPETPLAHLEEEVRVATALAEHGAPVAHLATLPVPQPLAAGGAHGTLWEYLPSPGHATYQQLGSLLRSFHELTNSLQLRLLDWQPLASARRRLDILAGQYPPDDIALLEHGYERIQNTLADIQPVLPVGVIHGQAEIGNVLLRDNQPVLADFERVAYGPREWDLIDTATTTLRFNLLRDQYESFAEAYGFDVMTWDGFTTLRQVWELRATTWLMQARNHRPEIAKEIQVRLNTWRHDNPNTIWRGF